MALSHEQDLTISIASRLQPHIDIARSKLGYKYARQVTNTQTVEVCGLLSFDELKAQENNRSFVGGIVASSLNNMKQRNWVEVMSNSNILAGMLKLGFFGKNYETLRLSVEHDLNFTHHLNASITDPTTWCPTEVARWPEESRTWASTAVLPAYMGINLIDKDLGESAHYGFRAYVNYMALVGALGDKLVSYVDPSAILRYQNNIYDPIF